MLWIYSYNYESKAIVMGYFVNFKVHTMMMPGHNHMWIYLSFNVEIDDRGFD